RECFRRPSRLASKRTGGRPLGAKASRLINVSKASTSSMQDAPQPRSLTYVLFCLCIAIFGLIVAYMGSELSLGSVRRIGPGFFPTGLGLIIFFLALLTAFEHETAKFPRGGSRAL